METSTGASDGSTKRLLDLDSLLWRLRGLKAKVRRHHEMPLSNEDHCHRWTTNDGPHCRLLRPSARRLSDCYNSVSMTTSGAFLTDVRRQQSTTESCGPAASGTADHDRSPRNSLLRSRRSRKRSWPARPLLHHLPTLLQQQQLLAAFLFLSHTVASLTTKLPMQPQTPGMIYNGTRASTLCESTFRCDTSMEERVVSTCSCHPNCSLFDACCEDVRPSDWRLRALPHDTYECAVYPSLGTTSKGNFVVIAAAFVFLITGCPSNYSGSCLANLCGLSSNINMTDGKWYFTWVTDQLTGVTYKNRFCAACHGITEEQMVFWNQSYTCMNDLGLSIFGLTGCIHNFLSTRVIVPQFPHCFGPYYSRCPNGSSQQLQEACASSPARFIFDRNNFVTYRNYNCSLCDSSRTSTHFGCSPNTIVYAMPPVVDVVLVSGARGCLRDQIPCDAEQLQRFVQEPCTAIDFLPNRDTKAVAATPGQSKALHDTAFRLTFFTTSTCFLLLYSTLWSLLTFVPR